LQSATGEGCGRR